MFWAGRREERNGSVLSSFPPSGVFEVLVVHCGLAKTQLIEDSSVLRNVVGCHSWGPLSLSPQLSGASPGGFWTTWAKSVASQGHILSTPSSWNLHLGVFEAGASQVVLVIKNPHVNAGDIRDTGSIPWSARSPGGGNGNPLQYSCLENPMDRGAWWATSMGLQKLDMTEAT